MPKRLLNAIEKSDASVPVKMFRALVTAGVVGEDENLEIIRSDCQPCFRKSKSPRKNLRGGVNTSTQRFNGSKSLGQ